MKNIYHYTTAYAFNQIVNSGQVWASDCRFLNDRLELESAKRRFVELLPDGKIQEAASMALHVSVAKGYYCVFALTESPSVLSQWRAYADNGSGLCIGFSVDNLSREVRRTGGNLIKCIYEEHDEHLKLLVRKNEDLFKCLAKRYIGPSMSDSVVDGLSFDQFIAEHEVEINEILITLLSLKNPAFVEEKEWRIVYSPAANNIKTRIRDGLIIPYIDVRLWDWGRDKMSILIPEVWLGPKCDTRNKIGVASYKFIGGNVFTYDCGLV